MRTLRWLLAGLGLIACGASLRAVPPEQREKLAETSELTCTSNDDCWCRNFTGEQFVPGRERVPCCTQEDERRSCPAVGVCPVCTYE